MSESEDYYYIELQEEVDRFRDKVEGLNSQLSQDRDLCIDASNQLDELKRILDNPVYEPEDYKKLIDEVQSLLQEVIYR
jgi:chromosome segregation ATPase